jgi:hypothetical protein
VDSSPDQIDIEYIDNHGRTVEILDPQTIFDDPVAICNLASAFMAAV